MKKRLSYKNIIFKILISVLVAGVFSGIVALELLYTPNQTISDALYQRPSIAKDDILLLGIDQATLEDLGPFATWGRGLMGDILYMFEEDIDNLPAVIALDVLYVGASDDYEGDMWLADVVAELKDLGVPVVVGCAGTYGTKLVEGSDGNKYIDDMALLAFDEPYEELAEVAEIGSINAMLDNDGILRHGIYEIEVEGEKIPSMTKRVYELYQERRGLEATTTPYTDANSMFYVPFSQKPEGFYDGYGVIDVLYGDIAPSTWADKIVMIGPYAAGMQDDYPTAIDPAIKMYGVEYQANILQAFIDGTTKKEAPVLPQLFIVFAVTALMMFFLVDRNIIASIVSWLVVAGGYIGVCLMLYEQQDIILQPLYVPAFVTVELIVSVALNLLRTAREKARVRATFQRYVAPEIVGELLKEDSDALGLGGKTVDIAVLFVDIRGFTTMSESLPPDKVVSIINEYLTLTSECIFKNNGTLDKYVGDCTMAFWGAPLAQEDCIYKAVRAAFDMVEGAKELGKTLEEKYGRSVDFGVGVHFGPAVVGNIGSTNRMDYTAIGDTVNTAARLEANAPAGKIYVSRVVADALEGRVEFTSLGDSITLKGKAEGFEILTADRLV